MQDLTRSEQENMPESRQVLRTDRLLSVAGPFQVFESSRQITTLPYLLRHRGGEHGHTLNRMSGGHSFIKMNELSLTLKTMWTNESQNHQAKQNGGFPGGASGKASSCDAGDTRIALGQGDALEERASRSHVLAWKSPRTEESDRLQPGVAKSQTGWSG